MGPGFTRGCGGPRDLKRRPACRVPDDPGTELMWSAEPRLVQRGIAAQLVELLISAVERRLGFVQRVRNAVIWRRQLVVGLR